MSFFGRETVEADLALHKDQAGLVVTGTLRPQGGGTAVTLGNLCLWPGSQGSALGAGGFPGRAGTLTVWRTGEEDAAPRPDDVIDVAARTGTIRVQVKGVQARLDDDEDEGFAVYDCTYTRAF